MIHSDVFYANFDSGFASTLAAVGVDRLKGKPSKYMFRTVVGDLQVWFRVNPKASGVPHQPGEFWPEVLAPDHLRSPDPSDNGTVSWYQFVSAEHLAEVQEMRRRVAAKVGSQPHFEAELWRDVTHAGAGALALLENQPPAPRFPHTRLFYLDADDAEQWGRIFGGQISPWISRFAAAPETLIQYMWRVHWDNA